MPRFNVELLNAAMDERGLDGNTLAEEAKVDKNTISRARRGKRVSSATMLAISEALARRPYLIKVQVHETPAETRLVRVQVREAPAETRQVRVQILPDPEAVRLAKQLEEA